ncbi:hypothetical protein [Cellulomonas sp. Leaf334]|uniref:hypothetical protein n=1 Tax=Cellulomonas sp. Leaf334 TaxID=1736339 RepID=UPI000B173858|nr:hypothetical protein [Cellulomonas sp. Leaf334]
MRIRTRNDLLTCGVVAVAMTGCTSGPAEPAASSATGARALAGVPAEAPVEPGPYGFAVVDASQEHPVPLVTVPEGFAAMEDGIGVFRGDFDADDAQVLWIWDIDSVYTHPCEAGATAAPVGPTVADLAAALSAQPLREGTHPVPVTVGGYDGVYVELSMPDDVDVDACPGGKFNSWPGRNQQGPGQVDMLWILDVDGQRMTFDASASRALGPDGLQVLTDMVTTTTFVPAEQG